MTFDYKKAYKEFYMPPKRPELIRMPAICYAAVRGEGDPNEEGGAYKKAIGLLYGIAFTVKMSYRGARQIEGYFPYVVPPLEGLWRQPGGGALDLARKDTFQWISMIRLPEFVTSEDFQWAKEEAARKKETDFSAFEMFSYDEGLCVQCMHVGPYDSEPQTIKAMEEFMRQHDRIPDLSGGRLHHEIYLSDPRRAAPEKLKTVIRIPVKER